MTSPGSWVMDHEIWRGLHGSPDILPPRPPDDEENEENTVPPSFVAGGGLRVSLDPVTPPWPSNHQTGHLGLMLVETCAQAIGILPTGWAHLPTGSPLYDGVAGAIGSVGLTILYRVATSANELARSIGDSGDHQITRILTFAGVDPSNPFDGIWFEVAGTTNQVNIPGGSTTGPNRRIVLIVAHGVDSAQDQNIGAMANPDLQGLAGLTVVNAAMGRGGGFWVSSGVKATQGAFGITSGTLLTSAKLLRVAIALRPEPGTIVTPGAFRTLHGMMGLPSNLWGIYEAGDAMDGWPLFGGGFDLVKTGGAIDLARTAGACLVARIIPSNAFVGAPGPFSPTLWKGYFDEFRDGVESFTGVGSWGTGGVAKLREAIRDGVVRGFWLWDDFGHNPGGVNAFSQGVTFTEIDTVCCYHIKVTRGWTWAPLIARGPPTSLLRIATLNGVVRRYQYLDAGWIQYHCRFGPNVAGYVNTEAAAGVACGLGVFGSGNLLNGGCAKPGTSTCVTAQDQKFCAINPTEILVVGRALMADARVVGVLWWHYAQAGGTAYASRADVKASFAILTAEAAGRNDGPVNIRGDLTPA